MQRLLRILKNSTFTSYNLEFMNLTTITLSQLLYRFSVNRYLDYRILFIYTYLH